MMHYADRDSRDRADRLRQAGLRATEPRLAILRALEEDRRHPSAEMIHERLSGRMPSLSLSTVYVTLEAFLRTGLIRRVLGAGDKLRVDGTPQDHDHAICRQCGAIFDVSQDLIPRPASPPTLEEGMRVMDLRIEYDVVCSACNGGAPEREIDQSRP